MSPPDGILGCSRQRGDRNRKVPVCASRPPPPVAEADGRVRAESGSARVAQGAYPALFGALTPESDPLLALCGSKWPRVRSGAAGPLRLATEGGGGEEVSLHRTNYATPRRDDARTTPGRRRSWRGAQRRRGPVGDAAPARSRALSSRRGPRRLRQTVLRRRSPLHANPGRAVTPVGRDAVEQLVFDAASIARPGPVRRAPGAVRL